MAAVIYELWRRDDRSLLITPGTLPLDAIPVLAEISNYLDEAWTPVIATDVDGENALPQRLDNEPSFGRYSAARRVARTVFIGSAPVREAANRGLDDRRIKLGCVQPGESPATFGDALRRLANQALYLTTDGQRYWYSLQQTVTRLAADRAALHRDEDIDETICHWLRADKERGDFCGLHSTPTAPAMVPDEPEARLVVLGPQYPHSPKTDESPARDFAGRVLNERAGGPRSYRNMLVFAAPDSARLQELRDAVRNLEAWKSVERDRDTLNLDGVQRAQVEARVAEWAEAVKQRIGEAYGWLLVPASSPANPDVQWETTRCNGSGPLAIRASRKLIGEEALLPAYAGTRLRMDLDRVPLWRGDCVELKQLWSDYAQYLYLPRLRNMEVLIKAVEDGVSLLTWEADSFAFADVWDEATHRYVGLRAREQLSVRQLRGLVVKPEVARRQLAEDRDDLHVAESPPEQETRAFGAPKAALVHRFFGVKRLDPGRVSRDADQVATEVIQHLVALVGTEVDVKLEISAEASGGIPADVVRTVTENARTLKFDQHGFEEE